MQLQKLNNTDDTATDFRFKGCKMQYIDAVIVYNRNNEDGRIARELFFCKLVERGLELEEINQDDDGNQVFVLICSPFDTLCGVAERISLRMPIDVKTNFEDESEVGCCTRLEENYLVTDDEDDFMSAQFSRSWITIFKDHDNHDKFFRQGLRYLLTHYILINTDITDEETKKAAQAEGRKPKTKALEYLRMKKIIDDYIILHSFSDRSELMKNVRDRYHISIRDGLVDPEWALEKLNLNLSEDPRDTLHQNWIRKWRYQPLWKIRNYYGEKFAFYFAWSGHLITHLWFPLIFGLVCFGYGLHLSIWEPTQTLSLANATEIEKVKMIVEGMLNTVKQSFDNILTPIFAGVICVWGTIFTETWKRLSNKLAFEWDVNSVEETEPDRPEFIGTEERIDPISNLRVEYFPISKQCSRFLASAIILIVMLVLVFAAAASIILYRVVVTVKVCPTTSNTNCIILNMVLSSVLNALAIISLGKLYDFLAVKLTNWENHRTQSAYNNSLIVKLFSFQFVNSYSSLVYIAFFRGSSFVSNSGGVFGLGQEYVDTCGVDNNCMSMLSFQVLVLMLMKPLPKLLMDVILPLLKKLFLKCKSRRQVHAICDGDQKLKHPADISSYLYNELKKPVLIDFTIGEYMEKVLQYGYLVLFAASFPLAPLIALITNLVDIRVDAHRLLWMYRRPVPYVVASIGIWQPIVETLNILGVVSNSFIIAFTSSSCQTLTTEQKLMVVMALEHGLFGLKYLISVLIPDVPQDVRINIRREKYYLDMKKDKIELESDGIKCDSTKSTSQIQPGEQIGNRTTQL